MSSMRTRQLFYTIAKYEGMRGLELETNLEILVVHWVKVCLAPLLQNTLGLLRKNTIFS